MNGKFHAGMHAAARTVLALVLAALAYAGHAASTPPGSIPKASQQCLDCHGTQGLEKKLGDGDKLALHVDAKAFASSAHNILGCAVCHADATLENHPPVKKKMASAREYKLDMQKVCSTCHADQAKEYDASIHASLLREGNPVAPVCTSCHNPHAVQRSASYEVATGAPCSTCHGGVFEAYAGSVHGQARKQGRAEAPACATCHGAHEVKAAAGGEKIKDNCQACHSGALSAHQAWLPNAGLHLKTVSCAACHAPGVKRRVDLRLYASSKERITDNEGVPQFETRARSLDKEGKGLNPDELQVLLRDFGNGGKNDRATLRGRLEVDDGIAAHALAHKEKASARCEGCHSAGSEPFQRVTVSVVGADGRPVRYDAHEEVLNSPVSIDAVRGFYVIGGTRIKALDVLVVLALLGGIGVPVLHLAFGWFSRKYAKRIGGREDS